MTHERMNPKKRKRLIIDAATEVAREVGLNKMTRELVARRADISNGLVSRYYNTMAQLRRAVARRASTEQDVVILSQMVADPVHQKNLSQANRSAALEYLTGK